jgi:hypothetical protein
MTENPEASVANACHRCGGGAVIQWRRAASAGESKAWWSQLEQRIRQANRGLPHVAYVANRSDSVTIAVHGCEQHQVPDTHLLHGAACGGHGDCECEPAMPEIAPGDLFEEPAR